MLILYNAREMFIRELKRKNKDGSTRSYLYIMKSIWKDGKSYQKKIANLGRLDELTADGTIDSLTEKLAEFSEKLILLNSAKSQTQIENSKEYGAILVFRRIWEELGYDKLLKKYLESTQKQHDASDAVFSMVLNRLIAPSSKRQANAWLKETYEPKWEQLELQHFYRAMDFLEEKKEQFEVDLFERTKNLFNQELDLIMFDTTSISTWGDGNNSDLLKHGYSKDKRGDLKQIIVGVLMSKEGVPVGHEVWEGNQSDLKSFLKIIDKVKKRFQIGKLIFVCDRGMISQNNIKELDKLGYNYIIGTRMRQLGEDKQNQLLGESNFIQIHPNLHVKEIKLKIEKENEDGIKDEIEQRYIVCYNPKRAKEDAEKREYFREILSKKIEFSTVKDWVIKNGYKKYLQINGNNITIDMDEERLEKEKIFDGKWVLTTNTDLPYQDIAVYYKGLTQIEQGFRNLKSEIEIGPMYHWTTRRIRAHVFICFLALILRIVLKKKIRQINSEVSFGEVLKDLIAVKANRMVVGKKEIVLRTDLQKHSHLAFKAAGVKIPGEIIYCSSNSVKNKILEATPLY